MAIQIVYPRDNDGIPHHTFEERTFVMGQIKNYQADTQNLTIEDEHIPVCDGGYFSHPIQLKPGLNQYTICLMENATPIESSTISINRDPLIQPLSQDNPAINTNTILLWGQTQSIILMAGDDCPVNVSATPKASVSLHWQTHHEKLHPACNTDIYTIEVDGTPYVDQRTMIFQEPHFTQQLIPLEGYYTGWIKIPATQDNDCENIPLSIEVATNDGEIKKIDCPQTLSIWNTPRMGIVTEKKAVTRMEPNTEADRLSEQPEGTLLKLTGKVGDWYRCQLTDSDQFWIDANAVEILAIYAVQDKTLDSVKLTALNNKHYSHQLEISLSEAVPIEIESDGPWCRIRLFGALNLTQATEQFQVDMPRDDLTEVSIKIERLCGYDYYYEKNVLIVQLNQLPKDVTQVSILLDAGHGGDEWGAIGLDGTPEKNLNLSLTQQLQTNLIDAGFHVTTTRDDDSTVELSKRKQQVENTWPHITLSIHHNALPDGRNPMEHQGCCTFWYHSHSVDLAEQLQDGLSRDTQTNDYGVFYESFVLTRPTQTMGVLIELGFFTHPEEYPRLINPEFQSNTIKNMTQSLLDFVKNP